MMKACEAVIAWTPSWMDDHPTRGMVKVGPKPIRGWADPYRFTGGAIDFDRSQLRGMESIAMLFIDFHTLVVRDGIDPQTAHEAFLAVDEYRERISPEIAGADVGSE